MADELEEHFLDANERMGEALVEIGMALGLPRPTAQFHWGHAEIMERIAALHLHEVACPSCGATIRARMADVPPTPVLCGALIWPAWSNKWVQCASRVDVQTGACERFGHDQAVVGSQAEAAQRMRDSRG